LYLDQALRKIEKKALVDGLSYLKFEVCQGLSWNKKKRAKREKSASLIEFQKNKKHQLNPCRAVI
jgi:hypothetical protein